MPSPYLGFNAVLEHVARIPNRIPFKIFVGDYACHVGLEVAKGIALRVARQRPTVRKVIITYRGKCGTSRRPIYDNFYARIRSKGDVSGGQGAGIGISALPSKPFQNAIGTVKRKYLKGEIQGIHREIKDVLAVRKTRSYNEPTITLASADDIHKAQKIRQPQKLFPLPPGSANKSVRQKKPKAKTIITLGPVTAGAATIIVATDYPGVFAPIKDVLVYVPVGGFERPDGKAFFMAKPEGPVWRRRTYVKYGGQWIRRRGIAAQNLLKAVRQTGHQRL